MKYLIMLLMLVGCTDNCPTGPYRKYRYGQTVTVLTGLYKGFKGKIVERSERLLYIDQLCRIKSFKVRLNLPDKHKIVNISQHNLFVEDK